MHSDVLHCFTEKHSTVMMIENHALIYDWLVLDTQNYRELYNKGLNIILSKKGVTLALYQTSIEPLHVRTVLGAVIIPENTVTKSHKL